MWTKDVIALRYRNTTVGLPHGERIFTLKKKKVHLSKIEFLNFCFLSKKSAIMTLNSSEVTKCCKN